MIMVLYSQMPKLSTPEGCLTGAYFTTVGL